MAESEMTSKGKAIVAMSGGVDSSVTAALLKERGFEVVGVTLTMKSRDGGEESSCCGKSAEEAAGSVAEKIGIKHLVIDRSAKFESEILKPAWDDYDKGRTPSPCVVCNRKIKFQTLLDLAREMGAGKIATGHYARVERDLKTGAPLLYRGLDRTKDQSYFLFALTTEQLEATVFPLGSMEKKAVRAIAAKLNFSNADRPESQDACFVSNDEIFSEVLRAKFSALGRPGLIVDKEGRELATHDGIHRFTVGQRKGIGVSLGRRAWVASIDGESARVVLSDDPEMIKSPGLRASGPCWTGGERPDFPFRCRAQIRSQHKAAPAEVRQDGESGVEVRFDEPQNAVAPGQAVVFYDEDRVIGGAWIDFGLPNC